MFSFALFTAVVFVAVGCFEAPRGFGAFGREIRAARQWLRDRREQRRIDRRLNEIFSGRAHYEPIVLASVDPDGSIRRREVRR